jgi:RNA polymerase sigma-70 factor (ECF subfamily)
MHRLDGLSYAQIARQLGLSISAIEKHMASALAALARVNDSQ